MPPSLTAKAAMGVPGRPLAAELCNVLVVDNREVYRIANRRSRPLLAIGAVTSRAVLAVEHDRIQHIGWARHHVGGSWLSWQITASQNQ